MRNNENVAQYIGLYAFFNVIVYTTKAETTCFINHIQSSVSIQAAIICVWPELHNGLLEQHTLTFFKAALKHIFCKLICEHLCHLSQQVNGGFELNVQR